ncbi:MAG: hypothetical protein HY647_13895, partial [Acidobacteria bacterium]|nr:hypothetical protein [Acidobacteriota bacterium]
MFFLTVHAISFLYRGIQKTGVRLMAAALLLATPAFSQVINTIVGNAINDGRPALQTPLVKPQGLAVDAAGNLIIADRGSFVVRRVSASTGISSVLAGGGTIFDDAIPVPGKDAALDYPLFLALDDRGNIYFSDSNDYRVRKITPDGLVTTVAGTGAYGYSGDGDKATLAELSFPVGVTVDRLGNLYVADLDNAVVRRINLTTGIIVTIAGTGNRGYSGDGGPATKAELDAPWALAVDAAGNLYISDLNENVVRKVTPAGIISTEVPASAGLEGPYALAVDSSGRLYIADKFNYRVVRVGPGGTLTDVAGGEGSGFPQENVPATSVWLYEPAGLAFDRSGNLLISEEGWNLVRRVDASTGLIRTIAGTLEVLDGGLALNAPLAFPIGIAIDSVRNYLYIADTKHNRIRRVDSGSTIQTVAGNGILDSSPDGTLGSASSVEFPLGVSVDARGNLYFTEAFSIVRKLDAATGRLSTVAGMAWDTGYSGDGGPATQAQLNLPFAAVVDSAGNIYISDCFYHCIRRVDPAGIIRTVAGMCTQEGYSGDGGPATQA